MYKEPNGQKREEGERVGGREGGRAGGREGGREGLSTLFKGGALAGRRVDTASLDLRSTMRIRSLYVSAT